MSEQRLKVLALIGNACVDEGFPSHFLRDPVTVAREFFSQTGLGDVDLRQLYALGAKDDAWKTLVAAAFELVRREGGCPMPPCPGRLIPEGRPEAQRLKVLALIGNCCISNSFRPVFLQNPAAVGADYFQITRLELEEADQLAAIGHMPDRTRSSLASAMESVQSHIGCPMPPCPEELVPESSAG